RRATFTDTVAASDKDFSKPAPSAFNQSVPIGKGGISAGGRHYVGGISATSSRTGTVFVSDKDFPFRFREVATSGEEAGTSTRLAAGEEILAFAPVVSSIIAGTGV